MAVTKEELETRFTYHTPKEGQPEKYMSLRATAKALAEEIVEKVAGVAGAVDGLDQVGRG